MKVDFAESGFGYNITDGKYNPSYETELCCGNKYRTNRTYEVGKILDGIFCSKVPVTDAEISDSGCVSSNTDKNAPIFLAAVFDKVYINDTLINKGKFLLLITETEAKECNCGFKLKYSPNNTYKSKTDRFTNQQFFELVKGQLNLTNSCWFISEITIRNKDELVFSIVIVDQNEQHTYDDMNELRTKWNSMASPTGTNTILYGVPGCGKSYTIKRDYCNDEDFMERVVFHPDYAHSDFIGQILPTISGEHIAYKFMPGPFTRILKKAIDNPQNHYFLIIEELNRGNAPAILGDVFQLLDRIDDGTSEYGINNQDIALEVYGNANHQIKLPKNLSIVATMNTADQNVFTLDTAFKRRWQMKSIPNDINACGYKDKEICGTNVTWGTFFYAINSYIEETCCDNITNEDKRLGAFFVRENEIGDIQLFSEKILMYLWNDVFKYEHDKIFKSKYKTLEQLIQDFKGTRFSVFSIDFDELDVKNCGITVDEYLMDKNETTRKIYNLLISEVTRADLDYTLRATNTYIGLVATSGKLAAQIRFRRSDIKLSIREPRKIYQIVKQSDPTWTLPYSIILNETILSGHLSTIIEAINDSFKQVNNEQ